MGTADTPLTGSARDDAPTTAAQPALAPSPTWWGALTTLALTVSAAWFFTYALLDIPWQQDLGAWNYVIGVAFTLTMVLGMRLWKGDPHFGWRSGPTPPQQVVRDTRAVFTFARNLVVPKWKH